MALSPYLLVSGAEAAGTTTFQITVTASTTAGDAIVVGATWNSGNSNPSCIDSQGNSYALTTVDTAQTSKGAIFVALNTTRLVNGTDWIKVTYTNTVAIMTISAMGCSGILHTGGVDVAIHANGSSTAPSSGSSGTLAQASEWLFALIASGNPGGVPSGWSDNFAQAATAQSGTGQHGTIASEVVSATTAQTASATVLTTNWCCHLVSLRAKAAPAHTTIGGSRIVAVLTAADLID